MMGEHEISTSTSPPLLYDTDVKTRVGLGRVKVCVVGIGRIGLPTALSFAKSGLSVTGLDVNKSLVDRIRSGIFPLEDEPGYRDIFDMVTRAGKFTATTESTNVIPESDIVLLSLPTPMDDSGTPYYTALESVASQLRTLLTPGSVVIVESTVEPNFIESRMAPLIEGDGSRLRLSENFGLGVCPETANPGEILNNFESLPRLVGAMDERTVNIISEVYKHVFDVELVHMPNCRTANAVKLTTNVFRDVNVAFVNELAILFERLGIDTNTVLEAAKRKYNFEPHYPGAGVGGPCLPVNSYQLLNTASKLKNGDSLLGLVKAGRRINESMPAHVVELIYDGLVEACIKQDAPTIALLGLSYKPNVRDVQLAPSGKIINILQSKGAHVRLYDPYYIEMNFCNIPVAKSMIQSIQGVDAVVLVTDHTELRSLDPHVLSKAGCKVFVDCRGILSPESVASAGLVYRGVGRSGIQVDDDARV